MMIDGLFNSGALPVLERLVQFTGQRHALLTNDIANLSTPYFKPTDISPQSFQAALRDAVEQRRNSSNPDSSRLQLTDTDELEFTPHGIKAKPSPSNEGILFHDQNNRDLEKLMQHLVENTMIHRMGIELIRTENATLQIAIRERV